MNRNSRPRTGTHGGRRALRTVGLGVWCALLLGGGACRGNRTDALVPVLQSTPDGGEVWSVAETGGGWVAVGAGGTFHSRDHGRHWERVGPRPEGMASNETDVHLFATPTQLYATTFGLLFRSTDGGRSWTRSEVDDAARVAAVGEVLIAVSHRGVFRSVDRGATWSDTDVLRPDSAFARSVVTRSGIYVTDGPQAVRSRDGMRWDTLPGPQQTPAPLLRLWGLAAVDDTIYAQGSGAILVSRDRGRTWSSAAPGIKDEVLSIAGGAAWSNHASDCPADGAGADGSPRPPGAPGPARELAVRCPPVWSFTMTVLSGVLVASTALGVYLSADGGATWEPSSRGIAAEVTSLSRHHDDLVAVSREGAFLRPSGSSRWIPLSTPHGALTSVQVQAGTLFGTTASHFVRCGRLPGACAYTLLADPRILPPVQHPRWTVQGGSLAVEHRMAAVLGSDSAGVGDLLVSRDLGRTWHLVELPGRLPNPPYASLHLRDSTLYLLDAEILFNRGVWASRDGGKTWRQVSGFDTDNRAQAVAFAGKSMFIGARSGKLSVVHWRGANAEVNHRQADGLTGAINYLWVDPQYPRVIIAAGPDGLFWSNDAGMHFTEAPLDAGTGDVRLSGIFDIGGRRYVTSQRGIYLLRDRIPREGPLGRAARAVWGWHQRHRAAVWYTPLVAAAATVCAYVLGLLALLVTAWRRGSAALGRTRLRRVMRRVLLEAPGLSRRALFLGYARRLREDRVVSQAGSDFFGLPAQDAGGRPIRPEEQGTTLVARIAEAAAARQPVLVLGSGGAGKTTVLGRLAWLALQNRLPSPLHGYRPILVPASYYRGDLAEAIADVLRERHGVDVTRETLVPQLETGAFLVLFDGASEIEAGDREAALDTLLRQARNADFVRCRFVIASRPVVGHAPDVRTIRLLPLSPDVVSLLLPRYRLGAAGEARVRRQLERFGNHPIAPLLFTLAVADTDADPEAEWTRAALYERYFRRLLGAEGEGGRLQWAGWRMVLGWIACWSLLHTGQRGSGVLHEHLVARLQNPGPDGDPLGIAGRLAEFFGVDLPERSAGLHLVKRLAAAGILDGGPPQRWKFAHDTFEEFFAAAHIVDVLEATGRWPDVERWRTTPERAAEFREVLSFALEMRRELLFPGAPDEYPREWRGMQIGPLTMAAGSADGDGDGGGASVPA